MNANVLKKMMNKGELWGNMENANSVYSSPHLASSGRTSSIQREGGRKARKAHYTRKAILEREKEEKRRKRWVAKNPGGSESNWQRAEELRKTRRAINRRLRKKNQS